MKPVISLIIIIYSSVANAGLASIWVANEVSTPPIQSYIKIEPEYLSIPITLKADSKSAMERHQLIGKLEQYVTSKAASEATIDLVYGEVSLSEREPGGFKSYGRGSESNIYLTTKLESSAEIFDATERIYKFIRSLEPPEDTELNYGSTKLAIENPEQYIEPLKSKIGSELKSTKEALGVSLKATITGLSSGVRVAEVKNRKLIVFLPYVITYSE
ncbi:hypothetical protein [Teredinibacter purpureus]|uniref:hypothetical protein n=1 Tax=Teredinibacter purpureus TaxID=2731756 RepID=UPI0013C4209F|nr:hypothetical protein [Teredinibacter purpureus]